MAYAIEEKSEEAEKEKKTIGKWVSVYASYACYSK